MRPRPDGKQGRRGQITPGEDLLPPIAATAAAMATSHAAVAPYCGSILEFQTVQSQPPPGTRSMLTRNGSPPAGSVAANIRSSTLPNSADGTLPTRNLDAAMPFWHPGGAMFGTHWPARCRICPMDDVVERAIKAALDSLPRGEWVLLDPSERTRRIYHEMRRIDAEHAARSLESESGH
jgi:hypothetical protein